MAIRGAEEMGSELGKAAGDTETRGGRGEGGQEVADSGGPRWTQRDRGESSVTASRKDQSVDERRRGWRWATLGEDEFLQVVLTAEWGRMAGIRRKVRDTGRTVTPIVRHRLGRGGADLNLELLQMLLDAAGCGMAWAGVGEISSAHFYWARMAWGCDRHSAGPRLSLLGPDSCQRHSPNLARAFSVTNLSHLPPGPFNLSSTGLPSRYRGSRNAAGATPSTVLFASWAIVPNPNRELTILGLARNG
ncbi:hypothetical protein N7532_005644 [Penicillium argentinense]|uniref:Uncharacterized protein n=1 Tax=Penicillium argentinense TaxID=1131581 RepID=A0A9W9FE93_9EURO|nr:uncharacterized protein N7532_005644 [Penicillium argentinense]KAJ5098643.1 hypothetical protein N7532_005644 [Penicillium argentinense]